MTYEERVIELRKMLRACPEVLTPIKASKCSPLGKNKVYELIKKGEIRSLIYQNSYIISKEDLIEYLASHATDTGKKHYKVRMVNDDDR